MKKDFVLVIHAGAENLKKAEISAEKQAAQQQGLEEALSAGWQILKEGGKAVDAVEAAVRKLEDNELFNAGKGGSLTSEGVNEFDAAIMDGKTLQVGAVAGVKHVKNPISLARAIKDKSKHVFLIGKGAEEFARTQGLELQPDDYFLTEEQLQKLKEAQEEEKLSGHDTVGAVALDQHGNLAAATSTGGLVNQLPGRVGDSPIAGSGVYANNDVCAVSCTGDGEGIMQAIVAHEVYALMKYKNLSLDQASDEAMQLYRDKIEGDRNFIALDPQGQIAIKFETNLMFRAYRKNEEPPFVAIWKEDSE